MTSKRERKRTSAPSVEPTKIDFRKYVTFGKTPTDLFEWSVVLTGISSVIASAFVFKYSKDHPTDKRLNLSVKFSIGLQALAIVLFLLYLRKHPKVKEAITESFYPSEE
jgi:hypothetical protein